MTSRYARGTDVPIDRSEVEIKRTLSRYGADDIVSGQSSRRGIAFVQFHYRDLPIEARIPIPSRDDPEFTETPTGKERSASSAMNEWEKACRQRWRILLLLIKAKLEAIESGVASPEEELLGWILLPDGETVGRKFLPHVRSAVEGGKLPKLLIDGRG